MTNDQNKDLIDRIADRLPEAERAAFYREMIYCRSLPENDELLRVLRVMQFLTLLMERVPERVVTERERMEKLLAGSLQQFEKSFKASEASRAQLDHRLVQLPGFVAAGICPENIAFQINKNLHQAFVASTIPETAGALRETAKQIKDASSEFGAAAKEIGKSYSCAAERAREAITNMDEAIASASTTARGAAKELSTGFHHEYWWSVFVFVIVAFLLGCWAGVLFTRQLDRPVQKSEHGSVPAVQEPLPVKAKTQK